MKKKNGKAKRRRICFKDGCRKAIKPDQRYCSKEHGPQRVNA